MKDIILYRNGDWDGLQWCLESIKTHSPTCKVHLIGRNLSVPHIDDAEFYKAAERVQRLFVPQTNNHINLAWNCLARWLVIEEYCAAKAIKSFFTCDTDVLIFSDLEEEAKRYAGFDYTFPMRSGYFFGNKALRLLNQTIEDYYNGLDTEDTRYVKEFLASQGHISDMEFEFVLHRHIAWTDSTYHGDVRFDGNLGMGGGYEMDENGYKVFRFEGGRPFVNLPNGGSVRMCVLHCWGRYKNRMEEVWKSSLSHQS